jgi:hypothetical protein
MKGFTLIETLIYLGVLALFITSAASLAFAFAGESGRDRTALDQEEEGRFLMSKVGWALGQASAPLPEGVATTLSVRTADELDPIVIRYDAAARHVVMSEGEAEAVPITSGDIDALSFAVTGDLVTVRASIGSSTFMLARTLSL